MERNNRIVSLYTKYRDYLLLILLVVAGYFVSAYIQQNHKINAMSGTISTQKHEFSTWKDSIGREHARIKVVTEYITQLQPVYREKIDSTAELLKIAATDIKTMSEATSTAHGTISTPITSNDTIRSFSFNDGYLSIDGSVDSILAGKYTYIDRMHHVIYEKKKKFLGITVKKERYIDIYFDNPNTKISNADHIDLKDYDRPKRFGIGPSVGATYYNGSVKPYVGIGIHYSLIKF